MNNTWLERKKPACLERRFEFADYEQTREFLEQTAELAESEGYYPNMSFSRTHVSMTLYPGDNESGISESLFLYASQVDELAKAARSIC